MTWECIVDDAKNFKTDRKFNACITSPPYFGLRKYGDNEQEIGTENLEEYIDSLCDVFDNVREHLTDDATLWVNIGDSYNGSGGAGSDYKKGGIKDGRNKYGSRNVKGLAKKNLIGVGWAFAQEMQSRGWILRSEIIWHKTKAYPQPENYIKRPIPNHERILMFSKSQKYKYTAGEESTFTVWSFPPVSKTSHEAPFPLDLPMRCLLLATDMGDWVIDPFGGSGTTAVACEIAGRNSTMVELYQATADKMCERLANFQPQDLEWL
jgi:site-specific DNA-methyltransferase (cytosine-N4-specific)